MYIKLEHCIRIYKQMMYYISHTFQHCLPTETYMKIHTQQQIICTARNLHVATVGQDKKYTIRICIPTRS